MRREAALLGAADVHHGAVAGQVVGARRQHHGEPAAPARPDRVLVARAAGGDHTRGQRGSDACITDDTWALLAEHLDERQLIEVPVVVGQYHLVAYMLNSLGIEREPGLVGSERLRRPMDWLRALPPESGRRRVRRREASKRLSSSNSLRQL